MKLRLTKKRRFVTFLIALLAIANLSNSYAQEDSLVADTEDVLNSEQIDIDGTYSKRTAADRIKEMRKKLELKTNDMVDKKIEDMRIKEEMKLTNKLEKAFSGDIQSVDESPIVTTSAATQKVKPVVVTEVVTPIVAPVVIAPVTVPETDSGEKIKIIPTFGITNMQGDLVNFESKTNFGIGVESMFSKNFSAGVKFVHTTMELTDMASEYQYYQNNSYYNQNYYGPEYGNYYSKGREIKYSQLIFSVNGKYFISYGKKIRPFVGLGLNYNRSKLGYEDEGNNAGPYIYNNVYYGDENFSTSYLSGTILLGGEIAFTETFGMLLEFNYTKGFTGGFSSNSSARTRYTNPDQLKLEGISSNIEKAQFYTLNVGAVLSF